MRIDEVGVEQLTTLVEDELAFARSIPEGALDALWGFGETVERDFWLHVRRKSPLPARRNSSLAGRPLGRCWTYRPTPNSTTSASARNLISLRRSRLVQVSVG